MANRFWVKNGSNVYSGSISDINHWSTTSGGAGGSAVPTTSDTVFFDANSYTGGDLTVTFDANQTWASVDFTGFAGAVIHNASVTITVQNATSTGVKFVAGMSYTAVSATTSGWALGASGSVFRNFTSAGYTFGTITINNNGTAWWQLADTLNAATISGGGGSFKTNAQTVNLSTGLVSSNAATRTIDISNSTINLAVASGSSIWSLATSTGLTFIATGSTINSTGNGNKTFSWGTALTYGAVVISGSGTNTHTATGVTFANFTRTSTSTNDTDLVNTNVTVTGTLTLNGVGVSRRLGFIGINSGAGITVTAAAVALSYVDFEGVTAAGAAAPFTGTSLSDCTGNSNVTFAAPRTLYYIADVGTWSDTAVWSLSSGGAGGNAPPLCQDNVIFDNNSTPSANAEQVTMDLRRYGNMDYSTQQNFSPNFRFASDIELYGNWKLSTLYIGQFAWDNTLGGVIRWSHMSGTKDFLNNGDPVGTQFNIQCLGGTVRITGANAVMHTVVNHVSGTLDLNGFDLKIRAGFTTIGAVSRTLAATGGGSITLNGVVGGTMWTASGSNLTLPAGAWSVIYDPETTAANGLTYTFAGGGFSYGNLTLAHTVAVDNRLTVTGANTFRTIASTGKGTITLPASTTTTATSLILRGTDASNLLTFNSSSSGTPATLSVASGPVNCDWMSLKDSTATGGATFYAGSHTTNVSGNTGWTFSDAPVPLAANSNFRMHLALGFKI